MKKTFLILIICALAELGFGQGYSYIKVDTSTTEADIIVVSNAFVSADALKADLNGTNTAFTVANWIAVSNTTTYAAALVWDATNKVFIVTETEE